MDLQSQEREDEIKSEQVKKSFKISLIYIFITFLWLIMSRLTSPVIEDMLKIDISSMLGKYMISTLITSIFVFFIARKALSKLWRDKLLMDQVREELREKDSNIKIASEGLSQHRKLIEDVLESASILIVRLDKDFNILTLSKNIKDIASFEVEDVRGRRLDHIVDASYIEDIREGMETRKKYKGEIEVYTKWGEKLNMYANIKKNPSSFKDDGYYTMVLYDVTHRTQLEDKINYLDSYDPLTDLPNRNLLERSFVSLLPEMTSRGNPIGLIYIDIDDFSFINETKGYNAGDYLLSDMAQRLKELIGEDDLIAKMFQDKFAIVLTREESLKSIDRKVREILQATKMHWEYDGQKYVVSTTMGVALYPKTSCDFPSLLKDANLALEFAKEYSRTNFEYYSPDMESNVINELSIVADIKIALEDKDFQMYYQPIVDLDSGKLVNAESLIRWFHPEKGYISPADFIPVAEKTGIIDEIGEYTIDMVFGQKAKWNKAGYGLKKVSINISAISFSKKCFVSALKSKIREYDLDPEEIVLELTESGFSSYKEDIRENVRELRSFGVQVAMDDFGTGYSSLARLKDLQLDYLKLDRSFIVSLLDENGQEIIKHLISLANALGQGVIAEGIETREQYQALRDLGCQLGQGYFLDRPMPASEIIKVKNI